MINMQFTEYELVLMLDALDKAMETIDSPTLSQVFDRISEKLYDMHLEEEEE